MNRLGAILAISLGLLLGGCASLSGSDGRSGFGQGVGLPNSWYHVGQAAKRAAFQRTVLWPLAGAATFGLTGLDDDVSEWANEEQPLFGRNAGQVSDVLVDVTTAGVLLSGAFAPAHSNADRLRGLGVEVATVFIAGGITEGLKSVTRRRRPNGRSRNSLPSGHATLAAASTHLWRANLQEYPLTASTQRWAGAATHAITFATAWARVEANVHHPSDVLLGIAVGNFVAEFLRLSVLDAKGQRSTPGFAIEMVPRGAVLTMKRSLGGRTRPKVWR